MLHLRSYYQDLKENDNINYMITTLHPIRKRVKTTLKKDQSDLVHLLAMKEAIGLLIDYLIANGQVMPEDADYANVVEDVE